MIDYWYIISELFSFHIYVQGAIYFVIWHLDLLGEDDLKTSLCLGKW